mmetsp:Transcript_102319/g.294536  ORF Transcript_102319/g.294536 Transcript_102319/m.294536 type:complete len:630 (-) Transcript_102319:523-2412(-)
MRRRMLRRDLAATLQHTQPQQQQLQQHASDDITAIRAKLMQLEERLRAFQVQARPPTPATQAACGSPGSLNPLNAAAAGDGAPAACSWGTGPGEVSVHDASVTEADAEQVAAEKAQLLRLQGQLWALQEQVGGPSMRAPTASSSSVSDRKAYVGNPPPLVWSPHNADGQPPATGGQISEATAAAWGHEAVQERLDVPVRTRRTLAGSDPQHRPGVGTGFHYGAPWPAGAWDHESANAIPWNSSGEEGPRVAAFQGANVVQEHPSAARDNAQHSSSEDTAQMWPPLGFSTIASAMLPGASVACSDVASIASWAPKDLSRQSTEDDPTIPGRWSHQSTEESSQGAWGWSRQGTEEGPGPVTETAQARNSGMPSSSSSWQPKRSSPNPRSIALCTGAWGADSGCGAFPCGASRAVGGWSRQSTEEGPPEASSWSRQTTEEGIAAISGWSRQSTEEGLRAPLASTGTLLLPTSRFDELDENPLSGSDDAPEDAEQAEPEEDEMGHDETQEEEQEEEEPSPVAEEAGELAVGARADGEDSEEDAARTMRRRRRVRRTMSWTRLAEEEEQELRQAQAEQEDCQEKDARAGDFVVKNTFIDIAPSSAPAPLGRPRSAPPASRCAPPIRLDSRAFRS